MSMDMNLASYGLIILGVLIAMAGVINHFLLKMVIIEHTSVYVLALGAILMISGLVLSFLSDRPSGSAS